MIFITLGSQKFPFDRLLEAVDLLCEKGSIQEPVFAQTGYSEYQPKHYAYEKFLDREVFARKMEQSDLVITHGGTGAIIGAVKKGKKVVAVPRLAKYGEHVDDHQLQMTGQFTEMDLITSCLEMEQLEETLAYAREHDFRPYESNTNRIIASLESIIEAL